MLNKLSATYQREIALSFISLFFITGLASAETQLRYNAGVPISYYPAYDTKGSLHEKNGLSVNMGNIFSNGDKKHSKNEEQFGLVKNKKNSYNDLLNDKNSKSINLPVDKISSAPNIGGPSQPEMATFKSVSTDNMVTPFTGDFSYNIPLMDVGGYPINMFYNSGITMDQDASWVGLGWNINPGTITRNMRGIPDDFDGTDQITKRQSVRTDKTWGVSMGAGVKVAGVPIGVGIDASTGLSINNKLGLELEASVSPSLSISSKSGDDKTASLSFAASLNTSSRNGASITPSVSVSQSNKNDDGEETSTSTTSLGASYTYSSRMGLEGMHLDASVSKSKENDEARDDGQFQFDNSSSRTLLSSGLSFLYPTISPSVQEIFTRRSYNLSFAMGGEVDALNLHASMSGYYTENGIDPIDQQTTHPAYGMLYYQNANNDTRALLDFNRANDGCYTPNLPTIAMPIYTYDIFTIAGEGVGGSFRATRNDLGYMRDPNVKTKDNSTSLGVDLGLGDVVHGGATLTFVYTPTTAGAWETNNSATNAFQFQNNSGPYQSVFFRNPGEKTIPDTAYQNSVLGGENLVRLEMSNTNSATPMLLPKLIQYDQTKNNLNKDLTITPQSAMDLNRSKRTQVISFLTADEARKVGLDTVINSYNTNNIDPTGVILSGCTISSGGIQAIPRVGDFRLGHHISEIDVLGTDGRKYVYGLPVYNTKQVDVSFSINHGNGSNATGKTTYRAGSDDESGNNQGRDWHQQQEEMPGYTHAFLLTGLVSPNYVDVTGDGISDDDIGDAIKFNYSRFTQGYKWRTPVGAVPVISGSDTTSEAAYSENLKTDDKDDKAHYVYGEREMYHLYSIESKNMVARFYIKNDRKDCKEVLGQNGGIDNTWGMQRLDKICLYSKADILNAQRNNISIANVKPIKTVQFFQSYKLCGNVDNNNGQCIDIHGNANCDPAQNINLNKGKLTLDSIIITYNGNIKKAKSKYVFYYPASAQKNPGYDYVSNDRWGNYKPSDNSVNTNPGGLTNVDYPYTIQDKTKADTYAAAWTMDSVLLPSGGTIHVDYESDDYAYVQDKRAAKMCPVLGFGIDSVTAPVPLLYSWKKVTTTTTNNGKTTTNSSSVLSQNDYVFIDISAHPITSTDRAQRLRDLVTRYFQDSATLYMKLAVVMPSTPYLAGSEILPIYADIKNYGITADGKMAWVQVKPAADGETPMVHMSLQFIKQQLPGKAYPGYDLSENAGAKAIISALSSEISSIGALMHGDDNQLEGELTCQQVDLSKSFARLTEPTFFKYGGGLRVKKIAINDNWNAMTGQYDATYGQEYKYTTTELVEGQPTVISSGVAAWEPSIGEDENPHKGILSYVDHNKGGPYNYGSVGLPLGEVLYPSPMIGYSRIEVLSIHRDTVKNMPTRQVSEFYTNRDFPFKSSYTTLTGDGTANVPFSPNPILQLLNVDREKDITQSQGFMIDMNDMNGKMKMQATYSATDSVNAISSTQDFYNVQKTSDNTYSFNPNFPTLNAPDGVVSNNMIGRDIELMADFRQHKTQTITANVDINFDFFLIGWFPVIIPMLLRPPVVEGTMYRSAAVLKVVNHYGILDSVETIDRGSMVSTKDIVYDAETGNPLLTSANNEHNKPVYNFTYPAHWSYSGMGSAYKNIDAVYSNVTFHKGMLVTSTPATDMSIFESGDEICVLSESTSPPAASAPCDGAGTVLSVNPAQKIWAVNTAKAGSLNPQLVFMDAAGNPITATNVTMRIVRSGHRNMLDQMVGSITTLDYPINPKTNTLAFNTDTTVLQASAATFKDNWKVDDQHFLFDTIETKIKYVGLSKVRVNAINVASVERHDYYKLVGIPFDPHYKEFTDFNPTSNVYGNDYFITGRRDDGGTTGSNWNYYSWIQFDPNAPVPGYTELLYAKLSLYTHNEDHPNFHTAADPCVEQPDNAHEHNAINVNKMTTPWTNDWKKDATYYYNNATVSPDNSFVIPGTHTEFGTNSSAQNFINNPGGADDRLTMTDMAFDMLKDKQTGSSNAYGIRFTGTAYQSTNGGLFSQCFMFNLNNQQDRPFMELYYRNCNIAPDPTNPDPLLRQSVQCPYQEKDYFCRSIYTRSTFNPYVTGILGDWRVDTTYAYYGDRKESDPTAKVDLRTGGTILNFRPFWNPNSNYLTRNISANNVWIWNSTITQYNRKGYEIENKDPLGRFNAGLYGYSEQLPTAVANNAREQEVMFDGFEDYKYASQQDCLSCQPSRHSNFDSVAANVTAYISTDQHHTGLYSLKVLPGRSVTLEAPVIDSSVKDKTGYGFRIQVDSVKHGSAWCTNLDNSSIVGNALTDTLCLLEGKQMLLSAWVNENNGNCKCSSYVENNIVITFQGAHGPTNTLTVTMHPTGNIIEGWQRYEAPFVVPATASGIKISLNNLYSASSSTSYPVYFDDIRIEPFNANLKSFVYNASNLRLMAELDENNYATFYEYDDDGTLTRVKKETERGVQTITETRSAMQKLIIQ